MVSVLKASFLSFTKGPREAPPAANRVITDKNQRAMVRAYRQAAHRH